VQTAKNQKNKPALISIVYAGFGFVSKGVVFFLSIWMAKILEKDKYADFNILYSLQTGVSTIAMAGIIESAIGIIPSRSPGKSKTRVFGLLNGVNVVYLIGVFAATLFGCLIFNRYGNVTFIGASSAAFGGILLSYYNYKAGLIRILEDHGRSLIFSFAAPFTCAVGALLAVQYFKTVESYYIGQLITASVVSLYILASDQSKSRPKFKWLWIKKVLLMVLPHQCTGILSWLSGYGMIWIAQFYLVKTDVAEFAFLYTLSSVLQLISNSMNQVWNPRFYNNYQTYNSADLIKKSQIYHRWQGVILGVFSVVFVYSVIGCKDLVGGNLANYTISPGLELLLSGYLMSIPWWNAQNYFFVEKKGGMLLLLVVISTAISFPLWVACVLLFGKKALYLGFPIIMLTRSVVASFVACKIWKVSPAWEGSVYGTIILLLKIIVK
jgi:O-antigen/teichoic acid export membrane protein